MSRHFIVVIAGLVAFAACTGRLRAEAINVPNGSFESPPTTSPPYSINIDSWQKPAKPDWYVESGGFLWSYNMGLFRNTTTNSADHIDNCNGDQAIWLFVVPEVALFQDYDSIDWNDSSPSHAFDASFEAGKSYHLRVGIVGTGGGMRQGATLELSLYYRADASNKMTVATTTITNTTSVFSNNTHLIDFEVNVPTVKSSDVWAGQHIGIQMLSTVDTNLEGGYWDLDNVRLSSVLAPTLLNPGRTNGQFQFTLQSEPGYAFEILTATNLSLSLSNWTSLGTVTNVTGAIPFIDTSTTNFNQRFYQARQLP